MLREVTACSPVVRLDIHLISESVKTTALRDDGVFGPVPEGFRVEPGVAKNYHASAKRPNVEGAA